MHVPAEPQHLPPTPDCSRLHIQYTVVSVAIVSPIIRSESGRARFVHQLSFDSVQSHKTPKQRLCCIHSPATSESSETAMATVVRDGLRLQSSIFPAGELVRGGSLSSVVVVCVMRG